MASVGDSVLPDPLRDSAQLGRDIENVQAEMERGIQLAGLKNDPVLPLIRVLSSSLSLQWRLHDQAMRYFCDASARLDQQLAETFARSEHVREAQRIATIENLARELAKLTAKHGRAWNQTVTLKTAVTLGGGAVALVLVIALASYGVGWKVGHAFAGAGAAPTRQAADLR
jgi:hypothetical protein